MRILSKCFLFKSFKSINWNCLQKIGRTLLTNFLGQFQQTLFLLSLLTKALTLTLNFLLFHFRNVLSKMISRPIFKWVLLQRCSQINMKKEKNDCDVTVETYAQTFIGLVYLNLIVILAIKYLCFRLMSSYFRNNCTNKQY